MPGPFFSELEEDRTGLDVSVPWGDVEAVEDRKDSVALGPEGASGGFSETGGVDVNDGGEDGGTLGLEILRLGRGADGADSVSAIILSTIAATDLSSLVPVNSSFCELGGSEISVADDTVFGASTVSCSRSSLA